MSGIEVAREPKRRGSKTRRVFLTVHTDPDFVRAAIKVGVSGYVVKSVPAFTSKCNFCAEAESEKQNARTADINRFTCLVLHDQFYRCDALEEKNKTLRDLVRAS